MDIIKISWEMKESHKNTLCDVSREMYSFPQEDF
jgi:hypothetical protein